MGKWKRDAKKAAIKTANQLFWQNPTNLLSYIDPDITDGLISRKELQKQFKDKEVTKEWYDTKVTPLIDLAKQAAANEHVQDLLINPIGDTLNASKKGLLGPAPFVAVHGAEQIGRFTHWATRKPVEVASHFLHHNLGVYKPSADLFSEGSVMLAEAALTSKIPFSKLNKLTKLQKGSRLHAAVSNAGVHYRKNIARINKDLDTVATKLQIKPNVISPEDVAKVKPGSIDTKPLPVEPTNIAKWVNKGHNVRIPNEDIASLGTLIKDDFSQIGRVKVGDNLTNIPNPLWSFTKGLGTGPTPLTRQLIKRGIKKIPNEFIKNELDEIFNMPRNDFVQIKNNQALLPQYAQSRYLTKEQLGITPTDVFMSSTNDWTKFRYPKGKEPTQVTKAYAISPEAGEQVADSLEGFYNRVKGYVASKGSSLKTPGFNRIVRNYPMYWKNEATGRLYRATTKGTERLSLKPVSRSFLENQQSTLTQKQFNLLSRTQIRNSNIQLRAQYELRESELLNQIANIDSGLIYYRNRPEILPALKTLRDDLNTQLENLIKGEIYTEHGYDLFNEKIRNRVFDELGVPINDSGQFQLGDLSNQYPVAENLNLKDHERFRVIKNRFETAISKAVDENGYYLYPNLVINYNPALSRAEYIIRIEKLDTLKVGRELPGVLSGEAILEVNYLDTDLIDRLTTPSLIRDWLQRKGITPVAKELRTQKPEKFDIRQSRAPVRNVRETWQDRLRESVIDILDFRAPRDTPLSPEQLHLWSIEEGGVTKKITPRGPDKKPRRLKGESQSDYKKRLNSLRGITQGELFE